MKATISELLDYLVSASKLYKACEITVYGREDDDFNHLKITQGTTNEELMVTSYPANSQRPCEPFLAKKYGDSWFLISNHHTSKPQSQKADNVLREFVLSDLTNNLTLNTSHEPVDKIDQAATKFRFRVTRDVTESVMVTVAADTIEAAQEAVLGNVEKYADTDDKGFTDWQLDDVSCGANDPYIPDENDWELVDDCANNFSM